MPSSFTYIGYIHQSDMSSEQINESLIDLISHHTNLNETNVFICGQENVVKQTQETLLEHNADEKRIKIQIL